MASEMQSWSGLRLGLMALGYRRVLWVHLLLPEATAFSVPAWQKNRNFIPPGLPATLQDVNRS